MPFHEQNIPSNAEPQRGRGLATLLTIASIVVIAAGVREAAGVITPILAAAFISMIAILPLEIGRAHV